IDARLSPLTLLSCPRRRGIQFAAASPYPVTVSGILDRPLQCAIAHKAGDDSARKTGSGAKSYRGRSVFPIRNVSIERAHSRPSRIAHTTSDWPRRMSPAEKTLGREVW